MITTVRNSLLLFLVIFPTVVMINNNENKMFFNLQNDENSKNEIYSLNNIIGDIVDISNKKDNGNSLKNDTGSSVKDRILLSSLL
ncbi:MAG: hypothetical protein K9W46_00765 [Candidatus Heimdallarchaeum endolithica]|uniref:Uncharacterized protein n=1 Tax=Candidatus Heimdallarchaeum endolithica TaxID=2876572 RepID=A0A9Y1BSV1_9ARCH|nr:MAG: hypothetical protein K9W46_00765 [Candidatus Heimdallarchaeum endolithica]